MNNEIDKLTTHTRKRGKGNRLTKQERLEIQEKFLEAFAKSANVSASCKEAGITRTTVYEWQEHDETFSMQFKIAEQEANDVIRAELFRRGVDGYNKPVVSMGKVVYHDGVPLTEPVYSDSLLALLAKARMPEFREKQQIDMNTTNTNAYDMQMIHEAIARALEPYPDAKEALIKALDEVIGVKS